MATIKNEAQLQQAIQQIQVLCRAIDSLRADIFPKNPRNFAIMAEGPVDEIRKLQADIDTISNTWKPRQLQPATEIREQASGSHPLAGRCQEVQTFLREFFLFPFFPSWTL